MMQNYKNLFSKLIIASVMAMMLLAGSPGLVCAQLTQPTQNEREITLAIGSLIRRAHLSRHPLDDEISERWLDNFLESLDPLKMYFYEADAKRFLEKKHDLDNMANRGDIQFAYEVFKVFLQRVDERFIMANKAIHEMQHDFSLEEYMIRDGDLARFPRNAEEAQERWRKRIKHDILVLRTDDKMSEKEIKDKLTRRYRSFKKRMHQTSDDELLEMYLTAMTTAYDPHTTYMSPGTLENFRIMMRLQLDGIGATLRSEDGYTTVTDIVPGGAADRDGRLKKEDRVIGVGQGEDGEIEDVVDMKLSDVVERIRGKRGTIVRLKLIPVGKSESVIYNIVRDKIELTESRARGEVIEVGKKPGGEPFKVGVINLPSFYLDMQGAQEGKANFRSTTRDVLKLIEDSETGFKAKGVDAVVMDLRGNGGGSLSEAIRLTGLFIDQGPVVQVKDWEGTIEAHADDDPGMAWEGPLVVLTSKYSASASEIFAGAIQDYDRGLIVGDPATHGKGTVQSLLDLGNLQRRGPGAPELGALKLTMQQFYRPNGMSTQKRGVEADVRLPSLSAHMAVAEGDLDYAVEYDRIPPAEFEGNSWIDDSIRKKLQLLSTERVNQSEDFKDVLKNVETFREFKDRKMVTLNEKEFIAEREELEVDQDEDEEEEDTGVYNRPVVKRDFYFDEALNITLDYLRLRSVAARR